MIAHYRIGAKLGRDVCRDVAIKVMGIPFDILCLA